MPTIPVHKQILHPKSCEVCEKEFQPKSSQHRFCSLKCQGHQQYISGYASTENQYKRISFNWRKYLLRLTYKENRHGINVDYLMQLLVAQDYLCALSGQKMTCILGKGTTFLTNASIDRIVPGSEYKEGNIRLVCRIANIMKWNMPDVELKVWCKRILDHAT